MALEELRCLLVEACLPVACIDKYSVRLHEAETTVQMLALLDTKVLAATLAGNEVVAQKHRNHASAIWNVAQKHAAGATVTRAEYDQLAAEHGKLAAEHGKLARRLEAVEQCTKKQRCSEDTGVGTSSRISLSVAGSSEVQMWDEYVTDDKVSCKVVSLESLLDNHPERAVVTSLRWLRLVAVVAPTHNLTKLGLFSDRATRTSKHEIPWHSPLLVFYQAAASGQEGVKFASEDLRRGDKAREDLRCLIHDKPEEPHEVKRQYIAASPDVSIHQNRAGFAKVLKCIVAKYSDRPVHLTTVASRAEGVWLARFVFNPAPATHAHEGQAAASSSQQQHVSPGTAHYNNLCSVEVAPGFPASVDDLPQGLLCQNLQGNLGRCSASSTLADFIRLAAAVDKKTGCPPPGFSILTRYTDQLCRMFNLQLTVPKAVSKSSTGGAASSGESADLSEAVVVHQGRKSLVLRLPDAPSVFKISTSASITNEYNIHRLVDAGCPFIRGLTPELPYGDIDGVGHGLRFVQLQHFCTCVSLEVLQKGVERFWWQAECATQSMHKRKVLHRDLKPANFLIADDTLYLNDFDLSCQQIEDNRRSEWPVGTKSFWSPRCDVRLDAWLYDEDDDWFALALTFAYWLQCYRPTCSELEDGASRARQKLFAVQRMLDLSSAPQALRERIWPVLDRFSQDIEAALQ